MKLRLSTTVMVIIGSFLTHHQIEATPIVYNFTGNVTGTLGSATLNETAFDFVFSGDTKNIYSVNYFIVGPTPVNPATSNSLFFSGIGSATSLDLILVQNFVVNGVPNFQDNTTLSGFVTGVNAAAVGWDLSSSIGPLSLSGGGAGGFIDTSFGTLNITRTTNLVFTATVIPEPSAVGLLGFVLLTGLLAWLNKLSRLAFSQGGTSKRI